MDFKGTLTSLGTKLKNFFNREHKIEISRWWGILVAAQLVFDFLVIKSWF